MANLRNKSSIILILACILVTLFSNSLILHAQKQEVPFVPYNFWSGDDLPEPIIDEKAVAREEFIDNIESEIRATQKDLYDVNTNIKDADDRLLNVQSQINTLSAQLANFDKLISQTEEMIVNVSVQINNKENELIVLMRDIEEKEVAIEHQKSLLTDYLEALYEQESAVTDTMNSNSEINIAKLLLSDGSIGSQLQEIKYLNILEKQGHEIFAALDSLVVELETDKGNAEVARAKLAVLYNRIAEEKTSLALQKQAKIDLLQQTRGEEAIYQQLLEESKKQQDMIQDDLKVLRENLLFIQRRMDELGDAFNPDDYKAIFSADKISVYQYINATKDDESNFEMSWPVDPVRGISAYFRDPSYSAVFGVRHNAIDIRAVQETVIRAPAAGVVYKTQDNGMGYSYLILAHKGGYMTVYGHVYQFMVEPGEEVFPGQAVALSGGMPGTKGAGLMTTGPHLHFELMKGGKYLDPMYYLPLGYLPEGSIPDKYVSIVEHLPPKVKRMADPQERATADGSVLNFDVPQGF